MTYSSLNLVFLGPPGSGKGTQARLLAGRYSIPHVSTGSLLRAEVQSGSRIGEQHADALAKGDLLPDRIVAGVVLPRLDREDCARGFLLDGFPRTTGQLTLFDGLLAELGRSLERVVLIDVPDDVALRRLAGRRVHLASGRVYHVDELPPKSPGTDDVSGEPLTRLDGDTDDVAKRRLEVYREHAAAVIGLFRGRGQLLEIDGSASVETVSDAVLKSVGTPVVA